MFRRKKKDEPTDAPQAAEATEDGASVAAPGAEASAAPETDAAAPAETRMGKGKGAPEYWVAVVKPGRILYEIEGVDEKTAREAMKLASQKLPVKTKFVTRAEQEGGAI